MTHETSAPNPCATTLPDTCTDALERYMDPKIFRALGDPTRLSLLSRLASANGPQTVTELSSCCGVHLSGVSRHLKMLHDAALIRAQRQGREVLYRLDCAALTATLRGMADALEQCQASCCDPPATAGSTSSAAEASDPNPSGDKS